MLQHMNVCTRLDDTAYDRSNDVTNATSYDTATEVSRSNSKQKIGDTYLTGTLALVLQIAVGLREVGPNLLESCPATLEQWSRLPVSCGRSVP
jgi:hypothetical protein